MRKSRLSLSIVAALGLSACVYQVDSVDFSFQHDGDIRLAASGSTSAPAGSPDNPNSFDTNAFNTQRDRFADCGFDVTRRDADGRVYLDLSRTFLSPSQFSEAASCAELPFRTTVAEYDIEEGLFQTTYLMNMRVVRPSYFFNDEGGNVLPESLNDFPQRITISVPGEIDDVITNFDSPGITSDVFTDGENRLTVILSSDRASENLRLARANELDRAVKLGTRSRDELESVDLDLMTVTIISKETAIQPIAWLIPLAFLLGIGGTIAFMRRKKK